MALVGNAEPQLQIGKNVGASPTDSPAASRVPPRLRRSTHGRLSLRVGSKGRVGGGSLEGGGGRPPPPPRLVPPRRPPTSSTALATRWWKQRCGLNCVFVRLRAFHHGRGAKRGGRMRDLHWAVDGPRHAARNCRLSLPHWRLLLPLLTSLSFPMSGYHRRRDREVEPMPYGFSSVGPMGWLGCPLPLFTPQPALTVSPFQQSVCRTAPAVCAFWSSTGVPTPVVVHAHDWL